MKKITVRYFAMFRENAGMSEETVTLDVVNAADVFRKTQYRHGSKEPTGHCKVAINDEMADWSSSVDDGDTVLLFPPVAGG
jgi:molybdopterin converting factor small subunit